MHRSFFALVCFILSAASVPAQAVDTTICDILAHPSSYNDKFVRVTGTVIAGFDEFEVKDTSCKQAINAIWLAYPAGTKAKAGPAAFLSLQLAKNSAGVVSAVSRTPVKLDANKEFKQFDFLLSAAAKTSGRCLGCPRSIVTATLTGRLDGVDKPGLVGTAAMFTAVRGFGNLNRYPARLVLQSVSNVSATEIDYSKPAVHHGGSLTLGLTADQLQRASAAFGFEGIENGLVIAYGVANSLVEDEDGEAQRDSPDGLAVTATFDDARLKGLALGEAMAHIGTHIADLRQYPNARTLRQLEAHAWASAILAAIDNDEKTLTLPGGYLIWKSDWSDSDREKQLPGAAESFLTDWAGLGK